MLVKFTEAPPAKEIDEVIDRTLDLKNHIPGIVDIQQGRNFSNRSKGYELGLTVRFDSREALERYEPHPKHQEIIAYLKETGLEDIIVVDFDLPS